MTPNSTNPVTAQKVFRAVSSNNGEAIDWTVDYPLLGKNQQNIASIGEYLEIPVKVSTFKGNTFVSNADDIFAMIKSLL